MVCFDCVVELVICCGVWVFIEILVYFVLLFVIGQNCEGVVNLLDGFVVLVGLVCCGEWFVDVLLVNIVSVVVVDFGYLWGDLGGDLFDGDVDLFGFLNVLMCVVLMWVYFELLLLVFGLIIVVEWWEWMVLLILVVGWYCYFVVFDFGVYCVLV